MTALLGLSEKKQLVLKETKPFEAERESNIETVEPQSTACKARILPIQQYRLAGLVLE